MVEHNNNPESNEKIQWFVDLFNEYDEERQDRVTAWERWTSMFRGVFNDPRGGSGKNIDGVHGGGSSNASTGGHKSKLFVNKTKQAIVSAVSNIMSIVFQQSPPFTVVGRASTLDEDIAKKIRDIIWYYLEKSHFPIAARRYITQAAIYGVTYGLVFLDVTRDAQVFVAPEISPIDGKKIGTIREERIVEIPTIKFETLDILDVWPDYNVPNHTEFGRGTFYRTRKSKEFIKKKQKDGLFRRIDNKGPGEAEYSDKNLDKKRSLIGLKTRKNKGVELFNFYGVCPRDAAIKLQIPVADDEMEVPVHCIFSGSENGLLDYYFSERNEIPGQASPVIRDIWEDVNGGAYGRGIPENVQGPQMALNATINSRLDNKATAIQQILGVNTDALADESDLQYRQNWVIRFEGVNPREAMHSLPVPDLTASAHVEAQQFERMIEEQSGINKFAQGTESFGSNRTATGINIVFQAASRFLRDLTFQFEQNLIAETLRLTYKYILAFMPDEILVLITEDENMPQLRQIALDTISFDVDFIPSGTRGLAMQEIAQNQLIQFTQATANDVDMQIIGIDGRRELLKRIVQSFGWKDAEKIVPDNPQPAPIDRTAGVQGGAGGQPADVAALLSQLGGQAG